MGTSITIGSIVNLPGWDRGVVVAESEGGQMLVNVKASLNDVPGIRYTSDRLQWYPRHSLSVADPVGVEH